MHILLCSKEVKTRCVEGMSERNMKTELGHQASNDDDQKSRKGQAGFTGFSGINMTFLMVLLNGFILTGTAYAILSVFINEMRADEKEVITKHFKEIVVDGIEDGEKTIGAITAAIPFGAYQNSNRAQNYAKRMQDSFLIFDDVDIVNIDKDSRQFLTKADLYQAPDMSKDKQILLPSSQSILSLDFGKNNTYMYIEPDKVASSITDPSFIIARKVRDSNGILSVFLFKTTAARLVDYSFDDWKEIEGYTIKYKDSYLYKDEAENLNESELVGFEQELFGNILLFKFGVSDNQRSTFLGTIPYLMLMFGGILTVIGTLYVYNNQRQSTKLAKMNEILAGKNQELSKQASEREKLFQALKKSDREHREVNDSVSDIIFETDKLGNVIFLNEKWFDLTGMEIKNTLGKDLMDYIHPKDKDEVQTIFENVRFGHNENSRAFVTLKTVSGVFRQVEINISVLRKDKNNESRFVGTITDVEERRKAEKAIAEAERKYRNIVENASAGIFQMTPEGQFLSANPTMAKMLGFDTSHELMQEITEFGEQVYVYPDARKENIIILERDGSFNNREVEMKHQDGHTIWTSMSARIVASAEGKIEYYEGIMEDITKRRQAEIATKQAKVESDLANRAKSEFLANMSHELRTPLNAIIGFSEIIKNEVFGPVGHKEYNEYASDIYQSGRRLLKVINEILDVSKIQTGERQLNENLMNVKTVLQSCYSLIVPKLDSNNITFENKIDDDVPEIIGEELAFKQMLMNVLSNAAKFTPSGGSITVSYQIDDNNNFCLRVSDTGVGMDQSDIDKAVSPFGQVDNSLARKNSGTGLGLTLVNSLILLHGGTLEIESEKSVGTTVSLVFPAKRVAKKRFGEGVTSDTEQGETNIVKFNDKK